MIVYMIANGAEIQDWTLLDEHVLSKKERHGEGPKPWLEWNGLQRISDKLFPRMLEYQDEEQRNF